MSSYVTKKKKDSRIEVVVASCRRTKFKGRMSGLLCKEQRRFDVREAGYIDYIHGDGNDDLGYDWLEEEYGIGKRWDRFNEDYIGVK